VAEGLKFILKTSRREIWGKKTASPGLPTRQKRGVVSAETVARPKIQNGDFKSPQRKEKTLLVENIQNGRAGAGDLS